MDADSRQQECRIHIFLLKKTNELVLTTTISLVWGTKYQSPLKNCSNFVPKRFVFLLPCGNGLQPSAHFRWEKQEPKKSFLLKQVPIVIDCKSSENWNKTFIRGRSRHSNVLKRFQSISWIRCRAIATSNSYLSHASQRSLIHKGSLSLVIANKNATKFANLLTIYQYC